MRVLLNQFVVYFLECFTYIKAKYVLQFSRHDDLQNTGFDPAIENRGINFSSGPLSLKLREARLKEALIFIKLPISHCYAF